MKKSIVFVTNNDDWEGMFVDGKLEYQNHSLHYEKILRILGIEFSFVEVNEEWLSERGRLPTDLADIKTND